MMNSTFSPTRADDGSVNEYVCVCVHVCVCVCLYMYVCMYLRASLTGCAVWVVSLSCCKMAFLTSS